MAPCVSNNTPPLMSMSTVIARENNREHLARGIVAQAVRSTVDAREREVRRLGPDCEYRRNVSCRAHGIVLHRSCSSHRNQKHERGNEHRQPVRSDRSERGFDLSRRAGKHEAFWHIFRAK
jgi:hypothetical protein